MLITIDSSMTAQQACGLFREATGGTLRLYEQDGLHRAAGATALHSLQSDGDGSSVTCDANVTTVGEFTRMMANQMGLEVRVASGSDWHLAPDEMLLAQVRCIPRVRHLPDLSILIKKDKMEERIMRLTEGIERQMERINLRNLDLTPYAPFDCEEYFLATAADSNADMAKGVHVRDLEIDGFDLILGIEYFEEGPMGQYTNQQFLGYFAPKDLLARNGKNCQFWNAYTPTAVAETLDSALEMLCDM